MSDADRIRQMVAEHLSVLWRFLRRLGLTEADADDAIQEVVLVAVRKIGAIAPGSERPYLLRTAYRIGSRMRARRVAAGEEEQADPAPRPDALVDQRRARALLDAILAKLGEEHRAVLVLHDVEGLTMAEIAATLELSPGTVASRLRRARELFDEQVARLEARMKSAGRIP
jgi:RNA polymerase sigma-70 factor (ECF subfamily)